MSKSPVASIRSISGRDIFPYFAELSRQPFMEVLALVMAARPTPEQLVLFARDHPDRWANMCAIFARLAGYTEKLDVTHNNFYHVIQHASDAELRAALDHMIAHPDQPSPLDGVIAEIAQERASLLPALPAPTIQDSNLDTKPVSVSKPVSAVKAVSKRPVRRQRGRR